LTKPIDETSPMVGIPAEHPDLAERTHGGDRQRLGQSLSSSTDQRQAGGIRPGQ
jgi:hypothetical protein